MHTHHSVLSAAATLLLLASADAIAGDWAYEPICRSNLTVNGGGWRLPGDTFFTNMTPDVNDAGDVAVALSLVAGTDGKSLWLGDAEGGSIVWTTPGGGFATIGDASLDADGRAAFTHAFTSPEGVLRYDPDAGDAETVIGGGLPFGLTGWAGASLLDSGAIGFRGRVGFAGQAWIVVDDDEADIALAEVGVDSKSAYSFLFVPKTDGAERVVGKARVGASGQTGNDRPDRILRAARDGGVEVLARDADDDPASPFTSFDNGVGVSDSGVVAFVAGVGGGTRAVQRWWNGSIVEIAREGEGELDEIEFFSPAVNDQGQVVFRGFDTTGRRAIWIGEGGELDRVVTEDDLVPTDLGTARIDQNVASSPVFGGGVSINDFGDVAFNASLTPPDDDQIEWGSGIFVAKRPVPERPADLNGDGVVDGADLSALLAAWGPCNDCPEDLDGDGAVAGADLAALLSDWG